MFWSELDEVMQSIEYRDERGVTGADFSGHVGEDNRGDEEVMGRFGIQDRDSEGQMVVGFEKRMEMAVVNRMVVWRMTLVVRKMKKTK